MSPAWDASVRIGPLAKLFHPLGMGFSSYQPAQLQWMGQEDTPLLDAMAAALEHGITHFDTASGYGDGRSEALIGRFFAEDPARRERVFLASKAELHDLTAQGMLDAIEASLARLQTEFIDLYYIHWPRTGQDMRPAMEGLETARARGMIGATGVSNFSVEQMDHVSEAGRIGAHQLNYNLFWRYDEQDLIPYCAEHGISVIVYSTLAHGILTGKFGRRLTFHPGDQRWTVLLFREDVWPTIYEAVEELKTLAAEVGCPLATLAIRWVLQRPNIAAALVGARNRQQLEQNAAAMHGEIPAWVFERMTAISDRTFRAVPDLGNVFGHYP